MRAARRTRSDRWEHVVVLDQAQHRLDADPGAIRMPWESAENTFAALKARTRAMHFTMKTLPRVSGDAALTSWPTT